MALLTLLESAPKMGDREREAEREREREREKWRNGRETTEGGEKAEEAHPKKSMRAEGETSQDEGKTEEKEQLLSFLMEMVMKWELGPRDNRGATGRLSVTV